MEFNSINSEYILSTKISTNQNKAAKNTKCIQYNHDKKGKPQRLTSPKSSGNKTKNPRKPLKYRVFGVIFIIHLYHSFHIENI